MSDPSAAAASVPESGGPDWDRVKEEIACPLCDYNLRGLVEPRCPECGYRFEWEEMLDPTRRAHPYLFEHHPERNWWSFWRTQWGGLFPGRFWRMLHPAQPSRPRRVVGYWLYSAVLLALVGIGIYAHAAVQHHREISGHRAFLIERHTMYPGHWAAEVRQYGTFTAYLDAAYPEFPSPSFWWSIFREQREHQLAVAVVISALAWPWLMVGALMIFQVSMRRARVKPVHASRCVIYSFDLPLAVAIVLFLLLGFRMLEHATLGRQAQLEGLMLLTIAVMLPVVWIWRIGTGYRQYLRFQHPFATIVLTHILVTLLVCTVIILGWLSGLFL